MQQEIKIDAEFQSLIPPLSSEEFALLEQSIRDEGMRDSLVVWLSDEGNVMVDGHNRYKILQKIVAGGGLSMATQLHGKIVFRKFADKDAAKDWIDRNQLARRNLSPDQYTLVLGRRYERSKKQHGGDRKSEQEKSIAQSEQLITTAEKIAAEHGVSRETVKRAGQYAQAVEAVKQIAPNIEQQIANNQAPARKEVVAAAKLVATEPETARAILAGEKTMAQAKKEQAKKTQKIRRQELSDPGKLPDRKYRIVYADPPWNYNDKCNAGAVQAGGCEKYYPSMTISELCALPIRELVEENAVLFFWVTSPLLFECAPVIQAWGFAYKASFVWDKTKHNMGHYNSVRHELLLICTRGSCLPDAKGLIDSVQSIERTAHSAKPEKFREIIDTLYTSGARIELFRRGSAPAGWDVWGNEVKE